MRVLHQEGLSRLAAALLGAAVLATGSSDGAWAQSIDPKDEIPDGFGHTGVGDLPTKRIVTKGGGMPSIPGPYPDTVNMEFLGQITNHDMRLQKIANFNAPYLSDIWGWTSPNTGDEYALVGTSSGVVFARITDPTNPEFLGLVPTTNLRTIRNFWWDLKTYNDHVYWTTEVNNAGVGIFDLTQLDGLAAVQPGTDAAVLEATARWRPNGQDGYVRAHNIAINEATGRAYLIGVTQEGLSDDAIIILDLTGDPLDPTVIGSIDSDSGGGPVDAHDAQVVIYQGPDADHAGREILFNYNGNALNMQIWDVTNAGAPFPISAATYPGATFTHQGWLTEDQAFALVGDEADEEVGLQNPNDPDLPDTARTYILDVRDLDAPGFHGLFDSPAASIDHNLFVKGDKVYQANYIAGVRVLQIEDQPDGGIALSEIAHMDTEPRIPNRINWNVNRFIGPWGVYPFFESGTIAASDGLNGLVLMKLGN